MSDNTIDSVVIKKQTLTDMANVIRTKTGTLNTMTPSQMVEKVIDFDVTNYPLGDVWVGTQQAYDSIQNKAANTIYYITTTE